MKMNDDEWLKSIDGIDFAGFLDRVILNLLSWSFVVGLVSMFIILFLMLFGIVVGWHEFMVASMMFLLSSIIIKLFYNKGE
jgi:hypothetical protein